MQQQSSSPFGQSSGADGGSGGGALLSKMDQLISVTMAAQNKRVTLVDKDRERLDERRNRNADRVTFRK